MGSDLTDMDNAGDIAAFQSTLPHGERPESVEGLKRMVSVSIHAPAWGATKSFRNSSRSWSVSIHAPAWGATGNEVAVKSSIEGFNPRSRMGSDAGKLGS